MFGHLAAHADNQHVMQYCAQDVDTADTLRAWEVPDAAPGTELQSSQGSICGVSSSYFSTRGPKRQVVPQTTPGLPRSNPVPNVSWKDEEVRLRLFR